ncbi:hypothetical protein HKCCE3408_05730 [Rhodobacterales bacterium HKCCE3408]|nr:hypothetical protein [Rhodobacterales bacterium HKCCE3408]
MPAAAQDEGTPEARPEPGWLSDVVIAPHDGIASSALPAPITAMPIGAVRLDAVGLLPPSVTGLPHDLWGASEADTLSRLFRAVPATGLPAMLSFTETLALAELDPPAGGTAEARLFLARLDMLLDRGALEPARALAERAGPTDPELFRRFFDVSLLTGQAERACAAMRANPDIAPAFPARIFCLARGGDWSAAALSLGTGVALGQIGEAEADLIAQFLDPELFEGEPPLPPDPRITPLYYEMRAAIGQRPASNDLPLAFAHSDLSEIAGWRAQLTAAERLMRAGAIAPQEWLAIATAHRPSASGAIWDRAGALQRFDAAILANDAREVARHLPETMTAMQEAGLLEAFATLYGDQLLRLPFTGDDARLAHRVALLSPSYERVALRAAPQDRDERFLFAIARGEPAEPPRRDALTLAVSQAFASTDLPERYRAMMAEDRRGEALLRAALVLLSDAADSDDIGDALRLFRAFGLEDTARRAALQLMLLDGWAA